MICFSIGFYFPLSTHGSIQKMNVMAKDIYYFFVPWFTESDWKEVNRLTFGDSNHGGIYSRWVERGERRLEELKAKGVGIRKVFIKATEYEKWCKKKRMAYGPLSRMLFVQDKVDMSSAFN
jgi:hypothetical protein